jgi:hypothetical protein
MFEEGRRHSTFPLKPDKVRHRFKSSDGVLLSASVLVCGEYVECDDWDDNSS